MPRAQTALISSVGLQGIKSHISHNAWEFYSVDFGDNSVKLYLGWLVLVIVKRFYPVKPYAAKFITGEFAVARNAKMGVFGKQDHLTALLRYLQIAYRFR